MLLPPQKPQPIEIVGARPLLNAPPLALSAVWLTMMRQTGISLAT